jgi:hypothetical protein
MYMITWQSELTAYELKKGSSGPQETGEVKTLWGTQGLLQRSQRSPNSHMPKTKGVEESNKITLQDEIIRTGRHSPGIERQGMAIEVKKKRRGQPNRQQRRNSTFSMTRRDKCERSTGGSPVECES